MTGVADLVFDITREQRAVVLTVRGPLDLAGSDRLGALLGDLIEGQGNMNVGVDLRHARPVDPAALGVLVVAASSAERRGGDLRVLGAPGRLATGSDQAVDPAAHLVAFYATEAVLAASVRDFVAPALAAGSPVVVVATPEHRALFETTLGDAGVDVAAARAAARYLDVDARETLAELMVDGAPDGTRFEAAVHRLLDRVDAGDGAPRLYGEMVGVLWAEGNVAAAVALEALWNRLQDAEPFSLPCTYPSSSFDASGPSGSPRAVCERHPAR